MFETLSHDFWYTANSIGPQRQGQIFFVIPAVHEWTRRSNPPAADKIGPFDCAQDKV